MLTVKINDGETELDIVDGDHVWFRHGGVELLIAGEDLLPSDRETLGNLRNRIRILTEELANHLLTLSLGTLQPGDALVRRILDKDQRVAVVEPCENGNVRCGDTGLYILAAVPVTDKDVKGN